MQYFTQVDGSLLFMVMDCIIIQEVKKLYFVILSRRKIHNISLRSIVHIILHGYGLQYNTSSKRVNYTLFYCLGGRPAKFQVHCSHCLPVYTWLWPAL